MPRWTGAGYGSTDARTIRVHRGAANSPNYPKPTYSAYGINHSPSVTSVDFQPLRLFDRRSRKGWRRRFDSVPGHQFFQQLRVVSQFEKSALRNLCVLCVSAVNVENLLHRRGAEDAETAQSGNCDTTQLSDSQKHSDFVHANNTRGTCRRRPG